LSGESEAASSGAGSLGVRFTWTKTSLLGRINVASSVDTITDTDGVGSFLLTPGAGRSGPSALIDVTSARLAPGGLRFHGYASVASSFWSADGMGTARANVMGLGLLWGRSFRAEGDAEVRDSDNVVAKVTNSVTIGFEAGLSGRLIAGDISDNDELRSKVLGAQRKSFLGPEVGFFLQVNKVQAGLQYYRYRTGGQHVPGLTRSQLVFAFTMQADIFTLPLDYKRDNP
jgi:hypothetical protein